MSLQVEIEKKLNDKVLSVSFDTEGKQGITGILGASGCGKSMTLKCIAGIETPDRGKIVLNGRVLFDSGKKINLRVQDRHVGYLFQNYALFPNMTVEKNIAAGFKYRPGQKMTAEEIKKQTADYMELLHVAELKSSYPGKLSGGQQQRVALARILASDPEVLMLDEPFAALDEFLRWKLELEDIIKEFGGTTLFVSHNRDEIYRICDRVCVMNRGQSSEAVPIKELFAAPVSREAAYLSGCKNFSDAAVTAAGEVMALDWGITLQCDTTGKEDASSVGVRSHFIHPVLPEADGTTKNVFPCKVERVIEDVFSYILIVSTKEEARIRVDVTKEQWQQYQKHISGNKIWIGIDEKDVMLLK